MFVLLEVQSRMALLCPPLQPPHTLFTHSACAWETLELFYESVELTDTTCDYSAKCYVVNLENE